MTFKKETEIHIFLNQLLQKLQGEWVQALGTVISGIVWVDKRCYDWSMVFKATINQSQVTLVNPNDPRDRCAEILYPFF